MPPFETSPAPGSRRRLVSVLLDALTALDQVDAPVPYALTPAGHAALKAPATPDPADPLGLPVSPAPVPAPASTPWRTP